MESWNFTIGLENRQIKKTASIGSSKPVNSGIYVFDWLF